MTVDEIFKNLATHMLAGLMVHQDMANYYDFLGLKGYRKCHEYHHLDETCGFRKLCHYYIEHYGKVIQKDDTNIESIIPQSWFGHKREDVETKLKRESVKAGIESWVKWEKETKKLYQKMFKQLMDLDEVAAALFLKCYIEDVDKELKQAEQKHLNMKALDYPISNIIGQQQEKYHKYKKKIKQLDCCY